MSFFMNPNSPPHPSGPHYARSASSSHSHSHSKHRSGSHSKPEYAWTRPASSSRHHSTSHYSSSRARPRDGYFSHLAHKIKRLLRKLYDYARRHPMKLFMLVIMPLITGGALADLLRRFGIKLPRQLERMIPGMSGGRGRAYGGYGRSGPGGAEGIESVMKLAKMFI